MSVANLPAQIGAALREFSGRTAFFKLRLRCRHGAIAVPLADEVILCRVLDSFRMVVSNSDKSLAVNLIAEGYWEPNVTRLIYRRVKRGMVCLDVGANVGYFALLMASLVGPQGMVYAVEPVPSTNSLLRRNIDLNGYEDRTHLITFALSDRRSEVQMVVPIGEPKNAAMLEVGAKPIEGTTIAYSIALDELEIKNIDFIKIDVEGAEEQVWKGMQSTLDRLPNIQILLEVNPDRYSDPVAFFEAIERRFPLRAIGPYGDIKATNVTEVAHSPIDVMLYLSRHR